MTMPIYEYRCSGCGHKFEELSRSAVEAEPKCPKCGSKEVKKTYSPFASHGGCGAPSETQVKAPRRFG